MCDDGGTEINDMAGVKYINKIAKITRLSIVFGGFLLSSVLGWLFPKKAKGDGPPNSLLANLKSKGRNTPPPNSTNT